MKAVMASVPEHILERGRRTGADQSDEMWDGVLHMAPSPNRDHQDFEGALEFCLRMHWGKPNGCRVYHQINIAEAGTWPNNYRIPDLVLLTPARFHIDCNEYFDGGPDAVVEVHSPDDEAYEKLPFYASVGIQEDWIIDRDTKEPGISKLVGGDYEHADPDAEGWLASGLANIEFRSTGGDKLEIRIAGRRETMAQLP